MIVKMQQAGCMAAKLHNRNVCVICSAKKHGNEVNMIVGKDVCKSFEGFKALDNASFHVRKGSVYGLVGPNGAGKSTLIRHITGVFEPDSGSINVEGENVFANSVIKEKIA